MTFSENKCRYNETDTMGYNLLVINKDYKSTLKYQAFVEQARATAFANLAKQLNHSA